MIREWLISAYLFFFKILFTLFRMIPLNRKKTVFVASFHENTLFAARALACHTNEKIVILRAKSVKIDFSNSWSVYHFNARHPFSWVRSVFHLATARTIFIDNYFGFLAAADFHPEVRCIQLWHAAGAIKRFGLADPSIHQRSHRARRRFQKVYSAFTHVVAGSEKMAAIFQESFGIPDARMIRCGVPRTDIFFDGGQLHDVKAELTNTFPQLQEKKIILYAPTYRDGEFHVSGIALDIKQMAQELSDEYILILKLHPAVQAELDQEAPDFVLDLSHYPEMNHLLMIADILISDYSSVPFEFALLNRPMIFFAYDLEEYGKTRGFWEDYEQLVPGPVVFNTTDVITAIKEENTDFKRIQSFAKDWNEYSCGHSSDQLIRFLYEPKSKTS